MPSYQDILQNLSTTVEQIRSSRVVGICFLDEHGRLIQLLEEDPELREVINEYYDGRLRQLIRSERAYKTADRLLTKQATADECA